MKPILMIQTYDGVIHEDQKSATKHLDTQYSDIMLRLTHNLGDLMYQQGHIIEKVSTYIDTHLDEFEKLRVIKADMELISNGEDMDIE